MLEEKRASYTSKYGSSGDRVDVDDMSMVSIDETTLLQKETGY